MTRRRLQWLALAAFAFGIANFLWFWLESASVGDALQGRIENGHYLLVNKGVVTEVPREAWEWSRFHAQSVFVTHPLALIAGFYLVLTTWPQIAGVSMSRAEDYARGIRASGPAIASVRTAARIGPIQVTAPLVRVDIHPGGFVLAVVGASPMGIEASSIVTVDTEQSRLSGRWTRINHRQSGVPADIRLYLADDHPVVRAIRAFAAQTTVEGVVPDTAIESPDRPEPYPAIFRVAIIFGFAVAALLIFTAITVVVPKFGLFGWLWTAGVVLITATNLYRYVIRDRDRW